MKSIAHADHYDIRTVKRAVEKASEERRIEEARKAVLLSALEKHYRDLVILADRMRRPPAAGLPLVLERDDVLLLQGLRQHLDGTALGPTAAVPSAIRKTAGIPRWPHIRDKMTHLSSIVAAERR